MRKKSAGGPPPTRVRIQRLQQRIVAVDYVCSGTLHERTKVCGKPTCRCAHDPAARHGPYYEWSRREGGKLVHSVVPRQQARLLAQAIRNRRKIHALLAQWEQESLRAIKALSNVALAKKRT